MKTDNKIGVMQMFLYHGVNWQFVIWMYPVFVAADTGGFFPLVILFSLYNSALSFGILYLINRFVLIRYMNSETLYYLSLILLSIIIWQLTFLGIKDPLPVFDLQQADAFYKGENKLFSLSPVVCSIIVFGLFYIRAKLWAPKT